VAGVEAWWREGERVPLSVRGATRRVFVRRIGSGPSITLLHGFPSSSHDWARVAAGLGPDYSLLAPDFLGFGASDKPPDHDYSLHEQADLVEALWQQEGIGSTVVAAHDYAVSVAQELLARRAEGTLAVDVRAVVLLNGGLYPDLHRPQPVQTALLDPEQGPTISAQLTGELLAAALAPTFGPGFDGARDSEDIWRALSHDDGHRLLHRLIKYMSDRRDHERRWVQALEGAEMPLAFVWGMQDPISGAQIAARLRERLPSAPLDALEHVGHWPPLEAPERVLAAIRSIAA
jgi:pimeloyl-ACP methyl ester carboxylesterase